MPDAITAPYSLELTKDEGLKDAVAGTVATVVTGKMKIFIGASVRMSARQTIVGALETCARRMLLESRKGTAVDMVVYADWDNASDANVTVAAAITGLAVTDVAIIVDATFDNMTTHFAEETFNQLIKAYLQNSVNN